MGYSPWDRKKLDITEHAHTHTHTHGYNQMFTGVLAMSMSMLMSMKKSPGIIHSTDNVRNIFLLMNYYARFWNYVENKKKLSLGSGSL